MFIQIREKNVEFEPCSLIAPRRLLSFIASEFGSFKRPFLREDVSRDLDCGIIIIFGYHHHQRLWCTIMVLHPARIFIVVILQRDELFGGIGYESK